MSKNTSLYNWQKWMSQTKSGSNKKPLNEMREEWLDLIKPDIAKAARGKNTNFKYFFDNQVNRIVIPYDQAKMNKLSMLLNICVQLVQEQTSKEAEAYYQQVFKKYGNFDPYEENVSSSKKQEILNSMPERFFNPNETNAYGFRVLQLPGIETVRVNIKVNVVKQKFIPAGGGQSQTKDVTLYEPIIEYVSKTPFSEKTPEEVVQKLQDEGQYFVSKNVSATIGQILQKFKEKELFEWWQKNQSKFTQDKETVEGAKEIFDKKASSTSLENLKQRFANLDENADSEFAIIISRAPIDVLRMSDFRGFSSCHSQPEDYGSEGYFYCTLAEARNEGAIAYLVKKEDLEGLNLNAPEIFADPQRGVKGIYPLQRTRLRRVVDTNTNIDFMAIEDRTYGPERKVSFLDTVTKWVANKTSKILINDPTAAVDEGKYYVPEGDNMILLGGHYTDSGNLGVILAKILKQSIKSIAQEDTEDYGQLSAMISDFEYTVERSGIEYEGEEDPSEVADPCEEMQTEVDYLIERFNRASYGYLTCDIDCSLRNFRSIDAEIRISTVINKNNNPDFTFNMDRISQFFSNTQNKTEIENSMVNAFNNVLSAETERFSSSNISTTIRVVTGPEIDVEFLISESFGALYDFEEFVRMSKAVFKSLSEDVITEIVMNKLVNLGFISEAIIKQENVQDAIQKFADEAAPNGNHFKWSDEFSDEAKRSDVFILVQDPYRIETVSNLPIIAKVPVPFQYDANSNRIPDKEKINALTYKLKEPTSNFNYFIVQAIEELFASELVDIVRQQKLPLANLDVKNRSIENPALTRTLSTMPQTPEQNLVTMEAIFPYEEIKKATDGISEFIDIRMRLKVRIDSSYQTEQQVINALNFMDLAGTNENYQKIIDVVNKVYVQNLYTSNPWLADYFKEQELNLVKSTEKAASSPVKDATMLPKQGQTGEEIGNSPLFSGKNIIQNQQLTENNKKKLVINERFKRLLRNIKK